MGPNGDNILVEYSLLDIKRIARGLASPRDSGEHKLAVMALTRLFGPVTVSFLVSFLVLSALVVLIKGRTLEKETAYSFPFSERRDELKPDDRSTFDEDVRRAAERARSDAWLPPSPIAIAPVDDGFVIDHPASPAPPLPTVAGLDFARIRKLVPRGPYDNRINVVTRDDALKTYNAPTGMEDRVMAALRWLKKKQDPDGSWKSASDVDPLAMTGLAALTFLAHGETPQRSDEFGPALAKAIRFMMAAQKADGRFSDSSYTHAIVTYALAEAFALSRIMEVREAMERGVAYLVAGQQEEGGFDYNYKKEERFDTSVAGWNIQALKAARLAGSRHPGLEGAVERSIRFLKTQAFAQNGSGFVYAGEPGRAAASGGRWTMTGVGTLALQILGRGKDPEARQGLALLRDLAVEWPAGAEAKPSLYGWYYVTQAKFQQGGSAWDSWNRRFSGPFLANQVREADGCGFWPAGDHGGAVYATALATLTLEVYYRYLPTYRQEEAAVNPFASDEFKVEVL